MLPAVYTQLHAILGDIYSEQCCITLDAKKALPERFKKVRSAFQKAIAVVHKNKGFKAKDLDEADVKKLTKATYDALLDGLNDGLRHEVPEALRKSLQNDVFLFSGFKTYTQLKEVSGLLLDDKGNIKQLEAFKQDVLKIDENYNVNYLEAEHQFATTSATVADRWQEWAEDPERYNLQFRTANDSAVRESHQALHNTTLPATDDFWNYYVVPLAWRCRCTIAKVLKSKYEVSDSKAAMEAGEKATTVLNKDGVNVGAIFRFNPGKDKVIFPPHHPYSKIANNAKDIIAKQAKDNAD